MYNVRSLPVTHGDLCMTDKPKGGISSPVLSSSSGGLFNGFFISQKNCTFDKANLVDGRARRVFEMVTRACAAEVYPYQLPLGGRSGPMVEAEGRRMLMLSSYDYLGLIGDPRIDDAAVDAVRKYGTEPAASVCSPAPSICTTRWHKN